MGWPSAMPQRKPHAIVFTLSLSITQPLQLNPTINTGYKRLNKITIKFWHGIKPTKHIVVNYNFTISHFGYSVTKPLKQTLELNVSLGIVAKLTHTLDSRNCTNTNGLME